MNKSLISGGRSVAEDMIGWLKAIGDAVFIALVFPPMLLWVILADVNCYVAHKKYHKVSPHYTMEKTRCSKCKRVFYSGGDMSTPYL